MSTILATYYARIQDVPDSEYKVEILEDGPVKKVAVNGKVYEVDYNRGGDSIYSIIIDHHSHGVQISRSSHSSYTIMDRGELYQIDLKSEMEKIHNTKDGADAVGRQVIVAPMPGVILKTYVKKGDEVKKGDPLCVLVAMKMENEIRSAADGIVKEIFVSENTKVGLNERVMVVE
ncbi:biotin/lipoyl-containing protein [Bacteroides sp.]